MSLREVGLHRAARARRSGATSRCGTVALAGAGFVAEAKRAPGVELVVVTAENRDALAENARVAAVVDHLAEVLARAAPMLAGRS